MAEDIGESKNCYIPANVPSNILLSLQKLSGNFSVNSN